MVEGYIGFNASGQEGIDQLVVEGEAGLIRASGALGEDTGPGNGQAHVLDAQLLQQLHIRRVFVEQVVRNSTCIFPSFFSNIICFFNLMFFSNIIYWTFALTIYGDVRRFPCGWTLRRPALELRMDIAVHHGSCSTSRPSQYIIKLPKHRESASTS
jgi:hypothetical protein